MTISTIRLLAASMLLLSAVSNAQESAPFQFSTINTNAPDVSSVQGARLALLYGKSGDVTGIDFALGYSELNNMKGISFPLFIGANRIRGDMTGISLGLLNYHEGTDTGVNVGALNLTNDVEGLSFGLANISSGTTLADVSWLNLSKETTFQLGAFNNTEKLKGIQIGILNCAENGFFRCFPIFNFAK